MSAQRRERKIESIGVLGIGYVFFCSCEKTTCVYPFNALLTSTHFQDCGTIICNESAGATVKRAGGNIQAAPAGKGKGP